MKRFKYSSFDTNFFFLNYKCCVSIQCSFTICIGNKRIKSRTQKHFQVLIVVSIIIRFHNNLIRERVLFTIMITQKLVFLLCEKLCTNDRIKETEMMYLIFCYKYACTYTLLFFHSHIYIIHQCCGSCHHHEFGFILNLFVMKK